MKSACKKTKKCKIKRDVFIQRQRGTWKEVETNTQQHMWFNMVWRREKLKDSKSCGRLQNNLNTVYLEKIISCNNGTTSFWLETCSVQRSRTVLLFWLALSVICDGTQPQNPEMMPANGCQDAVRVDKNTKRRRRWLDCPFYHTIFIYSIQHFIYVHVFCCLIIWFTFNWIAFNKTSCTTQTSGQNQYTFL